MDPFEINQLEEDIDKLEVKLQLGLIAEDKRKEIVEKKEVCGLYTKLKSDLGSKNQELSGYQMVIGTQIFFT